MKYIVVGGGPHKIIMVISLQASISRHGEAMEKIRQLMIQSGVSEEAADKICESFEAYKTNLDQSYGERYAQRIAQAKTVCENEVKEYKAELARRFQIFCESQVGTIESTVAKQAAQKETEAVTTLTKISSMIEGYEPENGAAGGALRAENEKLQRFVAKLEEDRKRAVTVANRQTDLANTVLQRNRQLERRLVESTAGGVTIKTTKEPGAPAKRLDESRKGGKPNTTRPTLVESQQRTPTRKAQARPANQPQTMHSPSSIAAMMG